MINPRERPFRIRPEAFTSQPSVDFFDELLFFLRESTLRSLVALASSTFFVFLAGDFLTLGAGFDFAISFVFL